MSSKKEFLDVIDFIIATGNGLVEAKADDGKITIKDAAALLPAFTLLPAALAGCTTIPAELKEFSSEDLAEIEAHILSKCPNIGKKWCMLAAAAFKIASAVLDILAALKLQPEAPVTPEVPATETPAV